MNPNTLLMVIALALIALIVTACSRRDEKPLDLRPAQWDCIATRCWEE